MATCSSHPGQCTHMRYAKRMPSLQTYPLYSSRAALSCTCEAHSGKSQQQSYGTPSERQLKPSQEGFRPAGRLPDGLARSFSTEKAQVQVGTHPHVLRQRLLAAASALLFSGAVGLGPGPVVLPPAAQAVLNSPNARIARSADAALRRSVPAFNPDVKDVQMKLEEIAFQLRIPQRKPWNSMASNVNDALKITQDPSRMLYGVPSGTQEEASYYLQAINKGLQRTLLAVGNKDADAISISVANTLDAVEQLELLQAPGLPYSIPAAYAAFPRLTGRATVELTIERTDGSLAFYDPEEGGPVKQAKLWLELDGYSAPISAGNFVANVLDGRYKNRPLQVNSNTVFIPGAEGVVQRPAPKVIPLEILPLGEFDPVYRTPLDVQQGELPVLPLSIYGAVSHAKASDGRDDGVLSGSDIFLYKFDRQQSGLAGLSFDEGVFGVFGYVIKGVEFVPKLTASDVVVAAKVLSGEERLVRPAVN